MTGLAKKGSGIFRNKLAWRVLDGRPKGGGMCNLAGGSIDQVGGGGTTRLNKNRGQATCAFGQSFKCLETDATLIK